MYKVFLVEDEILVRERVRDNVDWQGNGFVFAGEAPNGEIALPLIKEIKPDILITDIRMQSMDGLGLSRIVKREMPWIKIVILSGYDEFVYAKEAIAINVSEYLLKPVGAADLIRVLKNIAVQIENDKLEKQNQEIIQEKLKKSMQIMWERYLSDLATGIIPDDEAISKADYFGVDIISEYYCAGIIALGTITPVSGEKKYNEYIKAETIVNENIADNKGIIKYSENIKRIILIFKGDDYGGLEKNCQIYARKIKDDIERNTFCDVTISIGCVHQTIQGIAASIKDAEVALDLDKSLCKDGIISLDSKYGCVVSRAKQFINENYSKSGTTLNSVADYVCVSPNHFSAIFSQNTGMTFSEYLTYTRIKKAKELLITTNMKAYEIAFKVGYNDSHYFSNVFKKTVSLSPTDFRVSRKDNMLAYNRQQNTNRL